MLILIVIANVFIYAFMVVGTGTFSPSAEQLLAWGGNLGELSLHGQPWRLVSATFLHAGPQHILGNMVLLVIVGGFVEMTIGSLRFAAAYVVCGVAASLLSSWGHPDVVSVGASGAIAGLVGIVVAFYLGGRKTGIRGAWVAQTVGINAVYSLAPDVDWLAHVGGFGAGLAFAVVLLARTPAE